MAGDEHVLKWHPGEILTKSRPYWFCTCTRAFGGPGPGWVCYTTQPRKGMKAGKPERPEAQRLHRRHVEDCYVPEEEWFG